MQGKELRRTTFLPGCEQYTASSMTAGNDAEPCRIFRRWLRSTSTLDLNQNDLKSVSSFRPRLARYDPSESQSGRLRHAIHDRPDR
jgi:hypothetical protein